MTYKNSNPGVSGSQKYKWNDMYVDGIYPGEEYFFIQIFIVLFANGILFLPKNQ